MYAVKSAAPHINRIMGSPSRSKLFLL